MGDDGDRTALVVIDMFTTFDFEDGECLMQSAARATPQIADLVACARDADVAVLYVNDNYGDWNASRDDLVQQGLDGPGGEFLRQIAPPDDTLLIHKARHSIFYQTPLEYLLYTEGFTRLVLTGQVTEQCILYSALDAYLRHYEIAVPEDAVAGIHEHLAAAALEMMQRNMDVDTRPAAACLEAGMTGLRSG
jgi:nicotinamidase-related amidase